ncbi:MAG: hypothetical protein EOO14_09425 [Chitinophagaceae bacterium]|nr:MAG: hypothetical protein EOO14_09425 [Chitinophagaceae bacterium]
MREGGRFSYRMESKDGSMGFDFSGTFTKVEENKELHFTIDDGRTVQVLFIPYGNETTVKETFEAETTNPVEMQRQGWQAIMHHFKTYAEKAGTLNTMHFQAVIKAPVSTGENIPNRFVSIEHIGILQNGEEITSGAAVEAWAGSLENYTFTEEDGQTLVSVDVDSTPEHHAYFFETWPKALAKLKEICEA